MNAISVRGLVKRFDGHPVLDQIHMQVPEHSACVLLGPNGAGKTTTLRSLLGLVIPDGGEGTVLGTPIGSPDGMVSVRRRASYVERESLDPLLKVGQLLEIARRSFPGWDSAAAARAIAALALPSNRTVRALSSGMRTKLALILGLCRDADLVMLDEPTEGLDPGVRAEVLDGLRTLLEVRPVTLVIAAHRLEEVELFCDRLTLLDGGRTIIDTDLALLRSTHWVLKGTDDRDVVDPGILRARRAAGQLELLLTEHPAGVIERTGLASCEIRPATAAEIVAGHLGRSDADVHWMIGKEA